MFTTIEIFKNGQKYANSTVIQIYMVTGLPLYIKQKVTGGILNGTYGEWRWKVR